MQNPMLAITFNNILRTFEAEILKIFKDIQRMQTNRPLTVFNKTCVVSHAQAHVAILLKRLVNDLFAKLKFI